MGNTFDVELVISGLGGGTAPSLGAYSVSLAFDPTIVSFIGNVYGDPILGNQLDLLSHGSIQITTPGVGLIDFFELSLVPATTLDALQPASFTLLTAQFLVIGPGTSALTIPSFVLADSLGWSVTGVGTQAAAVASTPEPSSLLLIAGGILGVFALRRRRR